MSAEVLQGLIVVLIVAGAAFWSLRRWLRNRKRGADCASCPTAKGGGGSCAGCPAAATRKGGGCPGCG